MINFDKKILIIGFGSVSQCTVPVLFKHINVDYTQVTIMDFEDIREKVSPWTALGVTYINHQITPYNIAQTLSTYVAEGDLIIDLAWNIDCCEILQWCHDHGVLYINTSVEVWDPYTGVETRPPAERTLYWRHMNIRRMTSQWKDKGVTAVLEHGANPGLISHFTKQGLLDIADAVIARNKVGPAQAEIIKELAEKRVFNELAMELGVKVIHCSERDTQISDVPKQVDEFVNTWSVEGFREEGMTTAEMGWGTHEKELPQFAYTHTDGPKNQICLAKMGMNTWVCSWVPDYDIRGMVVRHGEAFTISDYLTVYQEGQAIYRPTVHYAYCPSDAAITSLHELRGYDYRLQTNFRIMNDEITKGSDILGALLMGHPFNSWWTGSDLSIEQSRALVPHQNATTMQVAISVVAACMWMIENPDRGVVVPDNIDHEYILGIAKPYLGNFISKASDWTPLKYNPNFFAGFNAPDIDETDPWQFKNFLITDND